MWVFSDIFSVISRMAELQGPAAKCDDNLVETVEIDIAVHLLEMVRTADTTTAVALCIFS